MSIKVGTRTRVALIEEEFIQPLHSLTGRSELLTVEDRSLAEKMLSVRVAAALARTLPRRAGFVSTLIKQVAFIKNIAVSLFNIRASIYGREG